MYHVFTRRSFKSDGKGGIIPEWGRKTTLQYVSTIEAARKLCEWWNANNKPGKYHRMAEFTKD